MALSSGLSRIGIAAAADHVAAGHELRVHAGGHEDGHAAGDGVAAARAQLLAVQIRGAADARQLPGDGLEDGRLAGAVRADERDDPAALYREGDLGDERLAVVADGQGIGLQIIHHCAPFLWSII